MAGFLGVSSSLGLVSLTLLVGAGGRRRGMQMILLGESFEQFTCFTRRFVIKIIMGNYFYDTNLSKAIQRRHCRSTLYFV